MSEQFEDIGVVAIGRNEGERLKHCLRSAMGCTDRVVYVDSGSTDDSVAFAQSIGVEVVDLDTSIPFTAARARNAGIERLTAKWSGLRYVQVLDGDCEIRTGWIQAAYNCLESTPRAAVVCGRRREREPDATIYNRMCDLEWDTPVGQTRSCGGDALFRLEALQQVGAYNPAVIAGEEPELCVRLRQAGHEVHRIDHEMTYHDAAMTSFGQYWKRAKRAGHAYAQGAHMHGKPPERHNVRQTRSALVWGLLLPLAALLLAYWTFGLSIATYVGLLCVQGLRIRRNELRRGRIASDASLLARFILLAKFAQAQGVLLFHWRRLTGQQATLIEYKGIENKLQEASSHG
jgi:GT2 family glycosyltransferase